MLQLRQTLIMPDFTLVRDMNARPLCMLLLARWAFRCGTGQAGLVMLCKLEDLPLSSDAHENELPEGQWCYEVGTRLHLRRQPGILL